MKSVKLILIVLFFMSMLFLQTASAQTIPDNGTDPIDVPVDLAIGLLATGAAVLGFKKK